MTQRHPGQLDAAEPLPEQHVGGGQREDGELGGEHRGDGEAVPRPEREGEEAGNLAHARGDHQRCGSRRQAQPARQRERQRQGNRSDEAGREHHPRRRQHGAGATGRVQAPAERDGGEGGQQDGSGMPGGVLDGGVGCGH